MQAEARRHGVSGVVIDPSASLRRYEPDQVLKRVWDPIPLSAHRGSPSSSSHLKRYIVVDGCALLLATDPPQPLTPSTSQNRQRMRSVLAVVRTMLALLVAGSVIVSCEQARPPAPSPSAAVTP